MKTIDLSLLQDVDRCPEFDERAYADLSAQCGKTLSTMERLAGLRDKIESEKGCGSLSVQDCVFLVARTSLKDEDLVTGSVEGILADIGRAIWSGIKKLGEWIVNLFTWAIRQIRNFIQMFSRSSVKNKAKWFTSAYNAVTAKPNALNKQIVFKRNNLSDQIMRGLSYGELVSGIDRISAYSKIGDTLLIALNISYDNIIGDASSFAETILRASTGDNPFGFSHMSSSPYPSVIDREMVNYYLNSDNTTSVLYKKPGPWTEHDTDRVYDEFLKRDSTTGSASGLASILDTYGVNIVNIQSFEYTGTPTCAGTWESLDKNTKSLNSLVDNLQRGLERCRSLERSFVARQANGAPSEVTDCIAIVRGMIEGYAAAIGYCTRCTRYVQYMTRMLNNMIVYLEALDKINPAVMMTPDVFRSDVTI